MEKYTRIASCTQLANLNLTKIHLDVVFKENLVKLHNVQHSTKVIEIYLNQLMS